MLDYYLFGNPSFISWNSRREYDANLRVAENLSQTHSGGYFGVGLLDFPDGLHKPRSVGGTQPPDPASCS